MIYTSVMNDKVATVLTACGIETGEVLDDAQGYGYSCNSTYRLRY